MPNRKNYLPRLEFRGLGHWTAAIVNHLYWSIATCNCNGEEFVERFKSIVHHTVNKHHFPHHIFHKKCAHEELSENEQRNKDWLVMGSPSHEKLRKIVTEKQILNDLSQITKQTHTALLEVFHASKTRYLPKSVFYGMQKTLAGTQLAALDHNNSINRQQVFSNLNANWTETITYWTKYYCGPSSSSTLYITTVSSKFFDQFWNEISDKSISIRKQVMLCIFK